MVVFRQFCENGHECRRESQPRNAAMPAGNLLLATGIFSSGSCASKATNSLRNIGVAIFSPQTHYNIQTHYIIPAVNRMWRTQQNDMMKGKYLFKNICKYFYEVCEI